MKESNKTDIKIALVGRMRTGKDTIADILVEEYGFKKFAFGTGIKQIIQEYFPEATAGGVKPREHYQRIGQELRKLNPDVWINHLLRRVENYGLTFSLLMERDIRNIVISDCRQLNEAERLRAEGYIIVKVVVPEAERLARIEGLGEQLTQEQLEHDTEKQVDLIEPDLYFTNEGDKEQLRQGVKQLIESLGGGVNGN